MKQGVMLLMFAFAVALSAGDQAMPAVKAELCKWKDGKQAVYLLQFDDNLPSQLTNAIPELVKRGLVGTFYINPGGWAFPMKRQEWEQRVPSLGMVYGNHTFAHIGAANYDQLDRELGKCQEEIYKCFPDLPKRRLVSFGQPGGVPWKVTAQEQAKLFSKYNLVDRPPYYGYPFWPTEPEKILQTVDDAIASGGMGHHDFHGVGGDYGTTPMSLFLGLLDKLEANRGILWITDAISYHKYLTEREGAKLQVMKQTPDSVKLKLACRTKPDLYDLPLSVRVEVPAGWTACTVKQGKRNEQVKVENGFIVCSVQPVSGVIEIKQFK
jgi:hypothetical protein